MLFTRTAMPNREVSERPTGGGGGRKRRGVSQMAGSASPRHDKRGKKIPSGAHLTRSNMGITGPEKKKHKKRGADYRKEEREEDSQTR